MIKQIGAMPFACLGRISRSIPKEACWHLSFIAADPAQTGKGHGSKLLDHTLRLIDEDKKPAYLESTNRANLTRVRRDAARDKPTNKSTKEAGNKRNLRWLM